MILKTVIIRISGYIYIYIYMIFLGLHPQRIEVPRLGVESELELLAYAAGRSEPKSAMPDLSCIYNLHHSSWQGQILNPLNKSRDRTYILLDTIQVHNHCATTGTPYNNILVFSVQFFHFFS